MPHRYVTAALAMALAATFALSTAGAQPSSPQQGDGVGDTSIFAPLDLTPSPNLFRNASGAPGAQYWQNRANYDLHATLDTVRQTLSGTMTLRYVNNSPDTLAFIWFRMEQNAFRPNSLNRLIVPQDSRFGTRDFNGGVVMERFQQSVNGTRVALTVHDHETVIKVDLAHPLPPGQSATLEAAWHFPIPQHGADVMGRDGTLYEIALWYPRVCVYDDLHGWNHHPYIGLAGLYFEYGNYTLHVTVPAGYIVAATGTLDNPHDVLTPTEITRLARAARSDTTVHVITAEELANGAARPKRTGMLTWTFHAANVNDAAFATSPEYQWDASAWHGILAQAYYRPSAAATWSDAADQSRMSIQEYTERWYPYPYPQSSAVEGPVTGTIYPMIAMEYQGRDKADLYRVITHEIGHDWFAMAIGSNGLHGWMDEGLNTFINTFSEARRYPTQGDQMQRASEHLRMVEKSQIDNTDIPVATPGDRILYKAAITNYVKPAAGMQLLRREILGPDAFDDAFRTYIKRWMYKHPSPADFYRTMEDVAGRRLDWFWREWFLENTHFDQAIDSVITRVAGDTTYVAVRYGNHARGVLPIHARFSFSDGTTQDFSYPAEVWSIDSRRYVRHYAFRGKTVTRIELDPDHRLIDIDRTNDSWTAR